ncbi:MAG: 50S ribosomal protein L5, partial [Deinococcus sp.]|nr:50S ribosomal protein L5 [Deinococcus sp.]
PMAVPKVVKVVLNQGLGGEATRDAKVVESASKQLAALALQRPVVNRARKSISNFKVRAGMAVGISVTLRGERMYAFLDKLVNFALPRIRDFRGLPPKSFDGRGNYSLGVRELLIFPEISYDMVDKQRGMDISVITNARSDEEGQALLEFLGFPFRKA